MKTGRRALLACAWAVALAASGDGASGDDEQQTGGALSGDKSPQNQSDPGKTAPPAPAADKGGSCGVDPKGPGASDPNGKGTPPSPAGDVTCTKQDLDGKTICFVCTDASGAVLKKGCQPAMPSPPANGGGAVKC